MTRLAASLVFASLVFAGLVLSACGPTEPATDPLEARAHATLEREHVTEVRLTRIDERTFDFTGTRQGVQCGGTVVVNSATTAAMQIECD
ncbi:MAG TPA: hypothetical protein ENK57_24910 [Polyangiaceae bacterium]|nr:hypothetical protein [Polyangiaceae bacterium]